MPFVLKRVEVGPMQNFCYVIGDEKSKEAMVVDPAWAPQKIVAVLSGLGFKLTGLLVSHAHFDHTNAIEELLNTYDVPVFAHKDEIDYAKSGNAIVGNLGRTVRPMNGGDVVRVGETEIRLLHTPGHTPGSQCFSVGDYIVTGDTLFIGGCGRSDLPGGNPELLFDSLKKIAALPPQTEICPGHDYGVVPQRSLASEIGDNPYLKMPDVYSFLEAVG